MTSFLAASGTGVYGTFELNKAPALIFLEKQSSLISFIDDRGTDLTVKSGSESINAFFKANKQVELQMFPDRNLGIFTLRAYSTPKSGATRVKAEARLVFLSLSEQKTEEERVQ